MKHILNAIRAILVVCMAVAILVPAAVYIVLESDWMSGIIRNIAEEELSALLGTEVKIGEVDYQLFDKLAISDISIADDNNQTALKVREIIAGFSPWDLLRDGRFVFDYGILSDPEVRLYKKTPDGPLNIAGILKRLKSKEPKKEPTRFDIAIYRVEIQNGSFFWDVYGTPENSPAGSFSTNHIALQGVNLRANAPRLLNDEVVVNIRDLSFNTPSGWKLEGLKTSVRFTPTSLDIYGLDINMRESHLALGTYKFEFDNPSRLKDLFKTTPVDIHIGQGSYVNTRDLAYFVPALKDVNRSFNITADVSASLRRVEIGRLDINEVTDGGFFLQAKGLVDNPTDKDNIEIHSLDLGVHTYALSIIDFANRLGRPFSGDINTTLRNMGRIEVIASVQGRPNDFAASARVGTDLGEVDVEGKISTADGFKTFAADADVRLSIADLHKIFRDQPVGRLMTHIKGKVALKDGNASSMLPVRLVGDMSIGDTEAEIAGYTLREFMAEMSLDETGMFSGNLLAKVDDTSVDMSFGGSASHESPRLEARLNVANFSPSDLHLANIYPGYALDANIDLNFYKNEYNGFSGHLNIDNFLFASRHDPEKPRLKIDRFHLTAGDNAHRGWVEIESDFFNGNITGNLSLVDLGRQLRRIVSPSLPIFFGRKSETIAAVGQEKVNNFRFDFVLDNTEGVAGFFKLPIEVIHPISIEGRMNSTENLLSLDIDAPYLLKGDLIFDETLVHAQFGGEEPGGNIYLTTHFPTKKGDMALSGGIHALSDTLTTQINWEIERDKAINGTLAMNALLSRDVDTGKLCTQVDFTPCQLTFGDDTWQFSPASIFYKPGELSVRNFELTSSTQNIRIDGTCNKDDSDSQIEVDLKNVVLITIFETLDIDKALIGGRATGTLHAGGIWSGKPFVTCEKLHVDNIAYNYCVLGDADVKAEWDNSTGAIGLSAVVTNKEGYNSYIDGSIIPAEERLDITFRADKINVGFMKPFMEAFADDVSGFASGRARLFGTFKYIDLEGDLYAQNLGLKVDFTNTWYYATDSIHIHPGTIDIKDVTVRDANGNKAVLNGFVKHTYFKDPVFDFKITDAHNFLCYDVGSRANPIWYGKIYGNGSAFIHGSPGVVNIDVNMATAPNSTFTFVLSDMEEAEQYNFLTFRDKTPQPEVDSITNQDLVPAAVRAIRDRLQAQKQAENPPSAYNMNIQMDITPDAKITLVMDPVGGDEIRAWGNGHMRMTYTSKSEDLRMYGSYTIDRGSYNFTLQDIIVKDFTIEDGSTITFTGDPYNANVDIKASYAVNANLTDLDESFLHDHELTRTNVPVKAMLLVKGDMRQPDIAFDLNFPTLSSDIYRKVRSIISTDEMMNSQIIYLLALNRFYTPEYMAATRGNELFSVASSTIASRLSSMLGKLSDNWSIAPNVRSDKGDFSDVQFDLALSSNLLNNRLRFNGNFGYRDKSLNTSQFIGDFDLEYLLNRSGTWRLKAYNRFNDQTYFLRTAKTTQGVGVSFQRDFDNFLDIFKTRKKEEPKDSIKTSK